jgi:hypothetical protein
MSFGDLIQSPSGFIDFSDSTADVTVTLDTAAISGNLLVAVHFTGDSDSVGCVDDDTDALTAIETARATDGGNSDEGCIYYKISDGTETSIVASSNVNDEGLLVVLEFEGPFDASPFDKAATSGPQTDTSAESGTTDVTTVDDEVVVAGITVRDENTRINDTWSNGFTERADFGTNESKGLGVASLVISVTGAQSTVGTLSASRVHMGMIATFKAAAGGTTAAVTGTIIDDSPDEADIVTGGKTIILTLTNDTWVATVGDDNGITDALILGITSAQSEGTGWNAEVRGNMVFGDITRTSPTVVTIILAAEAAYDITATETIEVTIPATALTAAEEVVATPTFEITSVDAPTKRKQRMIGRGIGRGIGRF